MISRELAELFVEWTKMKIRLHSEEKNLYFIEEGLSVFIKIYKRVTGGQVNLYLINH